MRTRHQTIIAVVMLTTALAADRAAMAGPILRPQIADTARRVADHLSRTFRHVVPAASLCQRRQSQPAVTLPEFRPIDQVRLHQTPDGEFRFRLPPPGAR